MFKANAIYWMNGSGPDNTGANNQYSQPIFTTSSVGCSNQQSIVMTNVGLMFQSDKGIWLLGRDLQTSYIGAAVESEVLGATVKSALVIPGTTQVRFTLDTGVTLMYDYFYGRWATFEGIPGISSTLYQNLHTYLDKFGQVFQEAPGIYTDGVVPVTIGLTSAWISLAGIQGYERFYDMLLLGKYITPFKLNVQFAFDFEPGPSQSSIVIPDNTYSQYGSDPIYGDQTTYGGSTNAFKARVFPDRQKVETFQIQLDEVFDSSMSNTAGAGLTLSGMTLTVGVKRGQRTSPAAKSFG